MIREEEIQSLMKKKRISRSLAIMLLDNDPEKIKDCEDCKKQKKTIIIEKE